MMRPTLLVLLALYRICRGDPWEHHRGHSNSLFIHSNDTITLTLSGWVADILRGPPGSLVDLEFVLTNKGTAGRFSISGMSEDGFVGRLDTGQTYLSRGQQQKIGVREMRVPQVPEGTQIGYTLTAERLDALDKRSAESQSGRDPLDYGSTGASHGGGTGSYGGSYGDSGSYDEQQDQRAPVGSSGSSVGREGREGAGGRGEWFSSSGRSPFDEPSPLAFDPSNLRELSLTVLFTVTSELEFEDDQDPWISLQYAAQESSETCQSGPGNPDCSEEWWHVRIKTADDDSGLMLISAEKADSRKPDYGDMDSVYYRYEQFHVGSKREQIATVSSQCCNEKIRVRVTDVAGNDAKTEAYSSGTGSDGDDGRLLSETAMWAIIGSAVGAVVMVGIALAVYCCTSYKRVPTNP